MARYTSLREFQERLAKRLAAAVSGERPDMRLGVHGGTHAWLLRLPDAGEVVAVPPLTSVPLTRAWFRGMGNVRGVLYSVTDLAAFTGELSFERRPHARLLLIGRHYGMNCALLVDRVSGLKSLAELAVVEPEETAPWMGTAYLDAGGKQWRELDVRALLESPDFMQVGA